MVVEPSKLAGLETRHQPRKQHRHFDNKLNAHCTGVCDDDDDSTMHNCTAWSKRSYRVYVGDQIDGIMKGIEAASELQSTCLAHTDMHHTIFRCCQLGVQKIM